MFTHHLNTIAAVKSSFWQCFHAGDHSRHGKPFLPHDPLPVALQSAKVEKKNKNRRTDSGLISSGLIYFFWGRVFFPLSFPFYLINSPHPENKMTPGSMKENLIHFFFSFYYYQPCCTFLTSAGDCLTDVHLLFLHLMCACICAYWQRLSRSSFRCSFTPSLASGLRLSIDIHEVLPVL